ncbi:MAG: hypothetical protein AAFA34_04930 [Thermoplasmata archaeon]
MAADPKAWGNCRFCAVAVPADAQICPICGTDHPIRSGEMGQEPRRTRQRVRFLHFGRALIVAVGIIALTYVLATVVIQGQPATPDPLTTSGTMTIAPGNFSVLSGEISGEDYVIGNFTVMTPPGALLGMTVYNESQYASFLRGVATSDQMNITPTSDGRIIFSAPYTSNFYFVFTNGYPSSSGLTLVVYYTTQYNTNVVFD